MQQYNVVRSFNLWTRGQVAELDPDSNSTEALLRAGYITKAAPPVAVPAPRRRRGRDE